MSSSSSSSPTMSSPLPTDEEGASAAANEWVKDEFWPTSTSTSSISASTTTSSSLSSSLAQKQSSTHSISSSNETFIIIHNVTVNLTAAVFDHFANSAGQLHTFAGVDINETARIIISSTFTCLFMSSLMNLLLVKIPFLFLSSSGAELNRSSNFENMFSTIIIIMNNTNNNNALTDKLDDEDGSRFTTSADSLIDELNKTKSLFVKRGARAIEEFPTTTMMMKKEEVSENQQHQDHRVLVDVSAASVLERVSSSQKMIPPSDSDDHDINKLDTLFEETVTETANYFLNRNEEEKGFINERKKNFETCTQQLSSSIDHHQQQHRQSEISELLQNKVITVEMILKEARERHAKSGGKEKLVEEKEEEQEKSVENDSSSNHSSSTPGNDDDNKILSFSSSTPKSIPILNWTLETIKSICQYLVFLFVQPIRGMPPWLKHFIVSILSLGGGGGAGGSRHVDEYTTRDDESIQFFLQHYFRWIYDYFFPASSFSSDGHSGDAAGAQSSVSPPWWRVMITDVKNNIIDEIFSEHNSNNNHFDVDASPTAEQSACFVAACLISVLFVVLVFVRARFQLYLKVMES